MDKYVSEGIEIPFQRMQQKVHNIQTDKYANSRDLGSQTKAELDKCVEITSHPPSFEARITLSIIMQWSMNTSNLGILTLRSRIPVITIQIL